ncbi:MAG TPA: hypothetical protein VGU21_09725 [Streptosporangiaceae bacterium]|nr:hypothetical protein [Streptosporangiaceae bacterium]
MLNHILKSRPARQGTTIERVWTYELTSMIAFGGRRRSAYRRLAAASEARPGDRLLRPRGRLPRQDRRRRAHDELHLCGAIMTRCRGE